MEEDTSIFPNPDEADPEGLVAYGGRLDPYFLLDAYAHGLYPLFSPGETPLWWSPDPRCVLLPADFHISRRSNRKIAAQNFQLTINHAFSEVIAACAEPRREALGDWIGDEIIEAYTLLHRLCVAFSFETWQENKLVGGLYGVVLKPVFFGESMFHRETEASRAALCGLVNFLKWRDFTLIDCQQDSPHMLKMGATLWPRSRFLQYLSFSLGSLKGIFNKINSFSESGKIPRYSYDDKTELWRKDRD